jgi:hypothetical protein
VRDRARSRSETTRSAPALSHVAREAGGSPTLDRIPILFNQDIAMLYVEPDKEDEHFYRNAQADELVYVAKGKGLLETVFGELPFGEGDYLIIHRGILIGTLSAGTRAKARSAAVERTEEAPKLLVFESRGHVRWPKRYRNEFGQLKEGAPYSERDIRLPLKLNTHDEMGDFRLLSNSTTESTSSFSTTIRSTSSDGMATSTVGVQHPRLRADRRPRSPTAAGAPDVRGRRIRRVLVLPAAVRLRSQRRAGAVQPLATWTRTRCCTTRRVSS